MYLLLATVIVPWLHRDYEAFSIYPIGLSTTSCFGSCGGQVARFVSVMYPSPALEVDLLDWLLSQFAAVRCTASTDPPPPCRLT